MLTDKRLLKIIGQTLEKAREESGLSQEELAMQLHVALNRESIEEERARFSKAFAPVLKEHMERSGLSLNELAELSRTDPEYLEELASGNARKIFLDTMILIARALNADAGDFWQEVHDRQEHLKH